MVIPRALAAQVVATVNCNGSGDTAAIQAAVDAVPTSTTDAVIELSGNCNISDAAPHGGGVDGVTSAAIVVRSTPLTGLTLRAGSNGATLYGAGDEAGIAVLAGNDNTTISGLTFVQVGRPVVVLGASGTKVLDNRILAGPMVDRGIMAVASSTSRTVTYGAGGTAGSVSLTPAAINGLTADNNLVAFSASGQGPSVPAPVVGIDVRQSGTAVISAVVVHANAIAMVAPELAVADQIALRVQATGTPGAITQVVVQANNIGRFDDRNPPVPAPAGTGHSGGRLPVVLVGVNGFDVSANMVRSQLGAAPTKAVSGIVVSGSSSGSISGNDLKLEGDASSNTMDLGGIAVVGGLGTSLGGPSGEPAAQSVLVTHNTLSDSGANRRGIVLAGAAGGVVADNTVTSLQPLVIGNAALASSAGLRNDVNGEVACRNNLGGAGDSPAGVSYGASAGSAANAYPGGTTPNLACVPTVTPSPRTLRAGDSLTLSGKAWSARSVTALLVDSVGATRTAATTAGADGSFSIGFSPSSLDPALADGVIQLKVTAADPSGVSMDSALTSIMKRTSVSIPPGGLVTLDDGGDGYTNELEAFMGVPSTWEGPSAAASVELSVLDSANVVRCGPFSGPPSGSGSFDRNCLGSLPEGAYTARARFLDASSNVIGTATASSVKDTIAATPVVVAPSAGSTVTTNNVPVSGNAEPGSLVTVRNEDGMTVYGSATTDNAGMWGLVVNMADGDHQVTAYMVDRAANRSTSSAPRAFKVDTSIPDTTAPDAPTILTPTNGAYLPATYQIGGQGEPGATITILNGSFRVWSATVAANGGWGAYLTFASGTFTIDAVATDPSGNVSAHSNAVTITVDGDAPDLVINTAPDTLFSLNDTVDVNGTAGDNDQVISVTVAYYRELNGSTLVQGPTNACSGCPGASVTWQNQPSPTLVPGLYTAQVVATDLAGNRTVKSVRFTVLNPN